MKILTILAALSLGFVANPVLAETPENRVIVPYGDLDLTKNAGQATFDKRLKQAAREVCRSGPTRSVRAASQARECMLEVQAKLAPQRAAILAHARQAAATETLARTER